MSMSLNTPLRTTNITTTDTTLKSAISFTFALLTTIASGIFPSLFYSCTLIGNQLADAVACVTCVFLLLNDPLIDSGTDIRVV